ncbi:hypothetical protein GLE_1826 [Lysobacter enzymogenes]|uniref:Uncharacterized protein n=1 Tax=Lysobacter enzymogenes TaxID=69 RepID=A0A0S2DF89_LYSEN|nr:hypothetical protein GLE_1826 [Lysobacter enzymogenes]
MTASEIRRTAGFRPARTARLCVSRRGGPSSCTCLVLGKARCYTLPGHPRQPHRAGSADGRSRG